MGDVEHLRRILAYITAASTLDELSVPPNYGLYPLTGSRAAISARLAVRFEKALGIRAETLLAMQAAFEAAQARIADKEIIARIARFQPIDQAEAL